MSQPTSTPSLHQIRAKLEASPSASRWRREILQRLLKLNHERYAEEVAQGLHDKKRGAGGVKRGAKQSGGRGQQNSEQVDRLFG